MSFNVHCNLCDGNFVFDEEPKEFSCICQNRPQGMSTFHICSECGNRRWGLRNSVDCEVCFAKRLSEKKVIVEPFGDMKNVPRRDPSKAWEISELSHEKWLEAQKQAQNNKILEQKSIIQTPILLQKIIDRLDKLLEREEFEVV